MQLNVKKKNDLVPGHPGTPGTKAPRSQDQTGRDLEILKVPWSRGPGTREVQKSRDLKIGKVPGQWKP